jgi:hypothetical protein
MAGDVFDRLAALSQPQSQEEVLKKILLQDVLAKSLQRAVPTGQTTGGRTGEVFEGISKDFLRNVPGQLREVLIQKAFEQAQIPLGENLTIGPFKRSGPFGPELGVLLRGVF